MLKKTSHNSGRSPTATSNCYTGKPPCLCIVCEAQKKRNSHQLGSLALGKVHPQSTHSPALGWLPGYPVAVQQASYALCFVIFFNFYKCLCGSVQIRLGLRAARTTLAQSLHPTFTQLRNLGKKPQLWGGAGRVKETIGCFP